MPRLNMGLLWAQAKELLKPAARTTTAGGTTALEDLRQTSGPVAYLLDSAKASAGTTPTLTPKLVHASAANGSPADIADVEWLNEAGVEVTVITDSADPGVLVAVIDPRETDGFVGFVGTIAGANASYTYNLVRCALPAGYVPKSADPA
jgi:hypothetical protein